MLSYARLRGFPDARAAKEVVGRLPWLGRESLRSMSSRTAI
jgi:hypothetical protein